MGSNYQYLDPENIYSNKNGVLYNIAKITEEKVLIAFESFKVSKRIEELSEYPIIIHNSETLLEINFHLFQDVYEWAGKVRKVNISKNGKPFFDGERFDMGFKYIDSLIKEYKLLDKTKHKDISIKLAEILDSVNYLHPFREGNGRTQREFVRLLALEKGLTLNLNPPDNKTVYERYMKGTIESDVKTLTELIFELITIEKGKKNSAYQHINASWVLGKT
jgi:cell filamentation protein